MSGIPFYRLLIVPYRPQQTDQAPILSSGSIWSCHFSIVGHDIYAFLCISKHFMACLQTCAKSCIIVLFLPLAALLADNYFLA